MWRRVEWHLLLGSSLSRRLSGGKIFYLFFIASKDVRWPEKTFVLFISSKDFRRQEKLVILLFWVKVRWQEFFIYFLFRVKMSGGKKNFYSFFSRVKMLGVKKNFCSYISSKDVKDRCRQWVGLRSFRGKFLRVSMLFPAHSPTSVNISFLKINFLKTKTVCSMSFTSVNIIFLSDLKRRGSVSKP